MGELDALTMERVREMDNEALRQLVAEILGWNITSKTQHVWPHGVDTVIRGFPPGGGAAQHMLYHNWPRNLDDAVALLHGLVKLNAGFHWHLATEATDSFVCTAGYEGIAAERRRERGEIVRVLESASMPARAVTLTWVAWQLARRE